MPNSDHSQAFLNALDNKLWEAADRLRSNLDAANYKHVVLGLIFLKYVSDAFAERQAQLLAQFRDPEAEYYLAPGDYSDPADYEAALETELEDRDYYKEANVFWVPKAARWQTLKDSAPLPAGTLLWHDNSGQPVTMRGVARLIDNALDAIERDNDKLKNILQRISQFEVSDDKLIGLVNAFSDTSFHQPQFEGQPVDLSSRDILGHVYEYFLGEFALAEGKQGGQYYTPKSIVTLIVEMLAPYQGRIYDPAMGSGGFFVSSSRFIEAHADLEHYDAREQKRNISIYGQESNPTTWRLAAMNMVMRSIDFNFGKKPADSFLDDQHPDLRADFVMANPPFNSKQWWDAKLESDPRWQFGTPPQGNANFAWMQHMLYHLAPTGTMALLLANGAMSSTSSGEGDIRRAMVQADLVECMVALPGQLFTNTQIPACIWILTKSKQAQGKQRRRLGEVLFIDARQCGYMRDRVLRDFAEEDIAKIADVYQAWRRGEGYQDEAGFCFAANVADIEKHDFVLTPGRYVGAADLEDDGEPFAEKMARLTAQLSEQLAESNRLDEEIKQNLAGLGYEF